MRSPVACLFPSGASQGVALTPARIYTQVLSGGANISIQCVMKRDALYFVFAVLLCFEFRCLTRSSER